MLIGEATGYPSTAHSPTTTQSTLLPGFSGTELAEPNPPAVFPATRLALDLPTTETHAAPASGLPQPDSIPAQQSAEPTFTRLSELAARPLPGTPPAAATESPMAPSGPSHLISSAHPAQPTHPNLPAAPLPSSMGALPVALLQRPLRIIGVVGRLYVLLESERGLVLLDQHAAHERILFEQMLQRLEAGHQAASQRLLLPETVELSVRDAEFVRGNLETLTRMGIGLSEFGDRTFLLDALPPMVKSNHPKRFTLDLIDALKAAGSGVNLMRLGEDVIAKTVCRHAVKANDPLSGRELDQLIVDLKKCSMPYTCPHGRPTMIEMGWRDLEKRFGRTG